MNLDPGKREARLPRVDEATVERLFRQARDGCSESLGSLLELCRAYLSALATAQRGAGTRDFVTESDLVQETLLRAACNFGDFEGETKEQLLRWLRTILVNCLRSHYRREYQSQRRGAGRVRRVDSATLADGVAARDAEPLDAAILSENVDLVDRALEQIGPELRQVVILRHWGDLTFAEIGLLIGRTADGARTVWYRAIDQLTRIIEQLK